MPIALLLALVGPAVGEPDKEAKPNRLAKESSPYLLQHAKNPVDWYPWGAEAFEKAKKDKKLVFLSIGYSSCHWCHVMEKESFEDKGVAELLNKHFVCIKVDREERPDVDEIYMTALQVVGGRGGWPLSMFLTADGKPIIGGTYWPREDQDDGKVRGFKSILKHIRELSEEKWKELHDQADVVAERTQEALERASRGNAIVEIDRKLARGAVENLRDSLDPVHGGIGNADRKFAGTKFPMSTSLAAVLRYAVREKDDELKKLVKLTLDKMANGGIYDHLGGGFHRYSTERTWTVPHFEKMLYDNGQLVELYAEALKAFGPDALYERTIRQTLAFVARDLTAPDGGFYSALDADSDGKEGESYVWTAEEIEKVLGKADAALFRGAYGVSGAANFEGKAYVLTIKRPLAEVAAEQKLSEAELAEKLAKCRATLLEVRGKRPQPFLDTKILTAWNGQMIAGYAKAAEVLKEPNFAKAAAKAADFVLAKMRTKDGRLLRTFSAKPGEKGEAKLTAYAEDYADFVHALLNLHDATGDKKWLDEAKALTDLFVKWYGDGDKGGYFTTSSDHEKLFARPKDFSDGAQPSSNGVAARNMLRLAEKTGDAAYAKLADKTIKQFSGVMQSNPSSAPGLCDALHISLDRGEKSAPKLDPKTPDPFAGLKGTEDVVKVSIKAGDIADGKQTVEVALAVQKPWHLYANETKNAEVERSKTVVEIKSRGKSLPAETAYPKGDELKDPHGAYFVYEGEVTIKLVVTRDPAAKDAPEVWIKVQACTGGSSGRCLKPTTIKLPLK